MHSARIVIADDDAVTRLDLRRSLEQLGYTVVGEADNGETACQIARAIKPDVVLLDIMMPQMNGLEAAERLNKERLGAIVLLTAYSDAPMIEQANRAGVLAYLVKPFRQEELRPAIEIALARYREMVAMEGALENAQDQMETARIVGRAKRVLMERYEISEQEALRRLQAQALTTKKTVREIAEAVLLTEDLKAKPHNRKT